MTNKRKVQVTLLVKEYDEAIQFYTGVLQFELLEDTILSAAKRWVRVAPKGVSEFSFLLAKAADEQQLSRVGNQTGGRVFLFLYVDEFDHFYQRLIEQKVRIVRTPLQQAWGTVAVFEDLYGNLWDLIGEN